MKSRQSTISDHADDLAIANLGMVKRIASSVASRTRYSDVEDLVGQGSLAVLDAARRFAAKGAEGNFKSYAYVYVHGKLMNYVKSQMGAGARSAIRRVVEGARAIDGLQRNLQREPTQAEIERAAPGYADEQVISWRSTMPVSLDALSEGVSVEVSGADGDPAEVVAYDVSYRKPIEDALLDLASSGSVHPKTTEYIRRHLMDGERQSSVLADLGFNKTTAWRNLPRARKFLTERLADIAPGKVA